MASHRTRTALALATVLLASLAPSAIARPTGAPSGHRDTDEPPPSAVARPAGSTVVVSQGLGGTPAAGTSIQPAMAAGGRYVAFASTAANLVADDTGGGIGVFVWDRSTGGIDRARPFGADGDKSTILTEPSISADGMVVAFRYDLGLRTVGGGSGMIVWDRQAGTYTPITFGSPAAPVDGRNLSVSADGSAIAFDTPLQLDPGDKGNEWNDVYLYDRSDRTFALVSVGANGGSFRPSVSRNGTVVAFASDGLTNADVGTQIYVRNMAAGQTELVSARPDGGESQRSSTRPSISDDGMRIAFESTSPNLVDDDRQNESDVFLRDRQTNRTVMVSAQRGDEPPHGQSGRPSISADGRMVAFLSERAVSIADGGIPAVLASAECLDLQGLVGCGVPLNGTEVYLRDMATDALVLISVLPNGDPSGATNVEPAVAGNGRFVAFASDSRQLADTDNKRERDVFLRDLPPAPAVKPKAIDFGTLPLGDISAPANATVTNTGWGPLRVSGGSTNGAAAGDYQVEPGTCATVTLHLGESCTLSVTFFPTEEGTRPAGLRVDDDFEGPPPGVRLTGRAGPPRPRARLEVDPASGPPGLVVVATGTGFTAGSTVELAWSRGITPTLAPITVEADGTFRVQVLVFHHDQTGERDLVAVPAGGIIVTAPYRVVEPPGQPPSYVLLPTGDDRTPMIIIRR